MYPGLSKLEKNQACDFSKIPCTWAYEVLSDLPINSSTVQSRIALWFEGGSIIGALLRSARAYEVFSNLAINQFLFLSTIVSFL